MPAAHAHLARDLSATLPARLAAAGFTQGEIARRLRINPSIVSLWCLGKRLVPGNRLAALAEALGITLDELLGAGSSAAPIRYCRDCGGPLRHRAERCRGCITRQNWKDGRFALAGQHRGDRWTPDEDGQLRAMAGRFTAAQIAERLGCRTRHAVNVRAHVLGVYIQTEDWTQHRICQLFGAFEGTVAKAWFASGLIGGYRLPPGQGCRQGEWRVREADLEAFIVNCPWAYDATRMVPRSHRLAQLAARTQRREPWVSIDEARAVIGGSRGALVRWCHVGVLPFKRRHVSGKRGGRSGGIVVRAADLPAARETILARQRAARSFITANLQTVMRQRRKALAA